MADKIIRVLAKDAPVKASAITAKEMVERSRQIHKTLPVATISLAVIADAFTGASLAKTRMILSAMLVKIPFVRQRKSAAPPPWGRGTSARRIV